MTSQATAIAAPSDVLVEKPRISSIDLMRGIVMVIMALDHVRDFIHLGATGYNPTDMQTTYPALFFTRWITHYCAPTFVLLAGTSIFLNLQRKPKGELSKFLLTRGLWLIILEFIVIRFGILFNLYYDILILQVIWVIGASMVCMAGFIHLSYRTVLAGGLVIIFGHNLFDGLQIDQGHWFGPVWGVIRASGFFQLNESFTIFSIYPLLPWLGIMMVGFSLGKLYSKSFDAEKRQKVLLQLGFGAIALFVILRFINAYGDPAPWGVQKNGLYTFMSFLNTTKYPVSLMYTLMTLGPVLVMLSLMEKIKWTSLLKPFEVFGRVPMLYYILHFYIIHTVSIFLFMNKTGKSFSELDFHFNKSFGGLTSEAGYSLAWTYFAWISLVVVLYPVCKWYNRYKSTHTNWWLSYI
jgi:uncharacterized membrane protein